MSFRAEWRKTEFQFGKGKDYLEVMIHKTYNMNTTFVSHKFGLNMFSRI